MALVPTLRGAVTPVAAPQPSASGSTGPLRRWRQRRRDQAEINRLAGIWHDLAIGLDLDQHRLGTLGSTVRVPHAVAITPGNEPRIIVRLLPGQTADDVAAYAGRIALEFGVAYARITARANRWAAIDLLRRDPLSTPVLLDDSHRQPRADQPVLLGHDGDGRAVSGSLLDLRHFIVQGQTGSGKSFWLYSLLGQLVGAPDILIAGTDVSGVLLRPFRHTAHTEWQATGGDVERHVTVLQALETEMDGRITTLPKYSDHLEPSEGNPLVFVVLEEFAGLLRKAAGQKNGKATTDEIKRIVARLVSEGRKACMFACLVVNRADTTVLPGFERGQAATRLSFRVDSADAILMLHAGGRETAEEHATAPSGVALLSAVGRPLTRICAPHVASYRSYCEVIESRAACLPGDVP